MVPGQGKGSAARRPSPQRPHQLQDFRGQRCHLFTRRRRRRRQLIAVVLVAVDKSCRERRRRRQSRSSRWVDGFFQRKFLLLSLL